ncbi:type IX secretion system periplasmic lipoprotein PorW/SprE [Apibacter adventoris]|uniref:Gliding motility protein n=1 Tax=Apibacter adventoris TaxID=1679466 RepID=A0A2S8AGU6_9FLAO|nr:tetratricopeptide repeat protein [Apibacter adventoris]PQL95462.1 hypothetical protein C4S77_01315 [Apibacter adventoris]
MKKISYTLLIVTLFLACSTKKNGITHRTYHRLTSWYNTAFNGQETLKKNLKDKEQSYIDNYATLLKVEPIDPFDKTDEFYMEEILDIPGNKFRSTTKNVLSNLSNLDEQGAVNSIKGALSGALGGGKDNQSKAEGLNRVIQKGKKAVESHSMLIKGKEYNSMLSDVYLLLGKAYYYKNDPFEALNYLNYMNATLVKNRRVNEAKIYIALAQAQAGNSFQAGEIYEELAKIKLSKKDRKLYSRSFSQFLIDEKKYEEAIEALNDAKKYNKGKNNRGRYCFIQGQLFEKLNSKDKAIEYYQKAYDKKPSAELEIKSQIALARLFTGDSIAYFNKIRFLKKLFNKGLYQSRKNELYYAMALVSLNTKKEKEAFTYLKQSIKENESDPQTRALAYQAIGDIYFSKPDYINAGAYYDSAVAKFTDVGMKNKLLTKNKSLHELIKKYYLVKKNDSILSIVKMNTEQRNEYFQKYIDKIKTEENKKKAELEKISKSENNTLFVTETLIDNSDFTQSPEKNNGGKWYFYNNNIKNKGQSDFIRLWGNRTLVDNWRRGSGISGTNDVKNDLLAIGENKNPRRFDVNYYIEQIPNNQAVIDTIKIQRDTAELSLGIIYQDKFYDLKSATSTLEHLLSTPPYDQSVTMAAMYNLYKFNKDKNPETAKKYADLVLLKYPDSKYAESILNPSVDVFKSRSSDAVIFYELAYKKYEERNYKEVKSMASQALEKYPTDEIIPKFTLLSVFCDARLNNKKDFMDGLERVSILFEDKPEGKKAADLLKFFNEKEKKNENSNTLNKERNNENISTQDFSTQDMEDDSSDLDYEKAIPDDKDLENGPGIIRKK